ELSVLGAEAERVQFPYARLALDLVEIEKVDSLEALRSALEVAHDLGVGLALDDITSGYGTLRCCLELAPRWIKVDSAITRGISRDRRRRAVLKMLARVARDFAVELVAEGIETAEDLDVCFSERVFAAQGHFLALPKEDPAPASSELLEWLAKRRPVPEPLTAGPAVSAEQLEHAEASLPPDSGDGGPSNPENRCRRNRKTPPARNRCASTSGSTSHACSRRARRPSPRARAARWTSTGRAPRPTARSGPATA